MSLQTYVLRFRVAAIADCPTRCALCWYWCWCWCWPRYGDGDFDGDRYFNGKRRAEQALLDAFPTVVRDGGQVVSSGTVLRPGFIYGERQIADGVRLPLQLVGRCDPPNGFCRRCGEHHTPLNMC